MFDREGLLNFVWRRNLSVFWEIHFLNYCRVWATYCNYDMCLCTSQNSYTKNYVSKINHNLLTGPSRLAFTVVGLTFRLKKSGYLLQPSSPPPTHRNISSTSPFISLCYGNERRISSPLLSEGLSFKFQI